MRKIRISAHPTLAPFGPLRPAPHRNACGIKHTVLDAGRSRHIGAPSWTGLWQRLRVHVHAPAPALRSARHRQLDRRCINQ
jgi:hypothetical protein